MPTPERRQSARVQKHTDKNTPHQANGYLGFRPSAKACYPGDPPRSQAEISIKASELWNQLSDADKLPYEARAELVAAVLNSRHYSHYRKDLYGEELQMWTE